MKTFVIGDIHGAHKALLQVLDRSGFDKENDLLITLGDIVDGWDEVYDCVETLLSIKNRIDIKGNHDDWFQIWLKGDYHPTGWLQGGTGTLASYCKALNKEFIPHMSGYTSNLLQIDIPQSHIDFFNNQKLFYKDHKNNIFTHGGFDKNQYLDYLVNFNPTDFYWNRDLWNKAMCCRGEQKLKFEEDNINKVFIGHTATINYDKTCKPMYYGGVWNLDQGAGWFGKLTIMNVETEEYFQSDNVKELYPDQKGRG